ncbi:glycosyltransferase family 4 protein [bacterium]|nr:glycosyltransferase family 4 protein [bacterium]
MKIAVDCHTLEVKNWAGKAQFLRSLLQESIKLDKSNKYILYFRNQVLRRPLPLNWQIKNIKLPTPLWQIYVSGNLLLNKIDVLFCPSAYLLPAINFLIPSVIMVHDLTTFLSKIKVMHKRGIRLKERLCLRLAISHSRKIVVPSQNTKQDLMQYFKVFSKKIVVIPEAARDIFCAVSNQKKVNIILDKYNLPEKFILFVGTLEPRKNIVRLIEAYYLVINDRLSIINDRPKLVIVGKKGWHYQGIFNKVKELNIEEMVTFLGYVPEDDLPFLYQSAFCFIYPSLYEGFGLPPLEAMACGCPVITSNISSLPEVVGEAAILVNPYKVDEIAFALKRILSDKSLRQELKQKGLIQSQKFSWGKTSQKILNILRQK